MKVCLIRRSFRLDGGAEASISAYLRALKQLNISCELICESWDSSVSELQKQHVATRGFRVQRARQFRSKAQRLIANNPGSLYQAHDWVPGAHVVRLGDGLHSAWIDCLKRSRVGLRRWMLQYSRFHHDRVLAERQTLMHPNLSCVIVNSELIARQVGAYYPEIRAPIHVVRNVLSPEIAKRSAVNSNSYSSVLGFAGSGWERKGLRNLIYALKELPEVQLMVAGQDKNQRAYENLADSVGVRSQIKWLGVLETMHSFYSMIDVLVHPALYDPSPNVGLEAMAYGVPVVTSTQTGIVDFAECHGIYVAPESQLGLSESIERALRTSEDDRWELRQFALGFDDNYLQGQLSTIYQELTHPCE